MLLADEPVFRFQVRDGCAAVSIQLQEFDSTDVQPGGAPQPAAALALLQSPVWRLCCISTCAAAALALLRRASAPSAQPRTKPAFPVCVRTLEAPCCTSTCAAGCLAL